VCGSLCVHLSTACVKQVSSVLPRLLAQNWSELYTVNTTFQVMHDLTVMQATFHSEARYIHAREDTRACTHTHTHKHTHMHTHAHTYTHTYTHPHAQTDAHTHARTHTHKHICTHRHTHARVHTHTCTHTHIHKHVHIQTIQTHLLGLRRRRK
jgi:hypothetical protein